MEPTDPRDARDVDDYIADELLSGRGQDLDPLVADVLGDVRVAFRSELPAIGHELGGLIDGERVTPEYGRGRSGRPTALVRRLAAATTLALVATGGLAVAGALPAPAQDAAARAAAAVGVDLSHGKSGDSHGHGDDHGTNGDNPDGSTSTSTSGEPGGSGNGTGPQDNHGAEVSAVAHDHTVTGCEHGRAVSAVASGETNDKPCPTPGSPSPTTAPTARGNQGDGQGTPPTHPEHPTVPAAPPGKPADPGSGPPASTPGATHPGPDGHALNG